jgi:hypothetical protein
VAVSSSSASSSSVTASSRTFVSGLSGTAPPDAEGLVGATDDAPDIAADGADDHMFLPNLPPIAHLHEGDVIGDTVVIHGSKIEGILNASEELRRHVTAFYHELIPLSDGAGNSYKLFTRRTYDRILHALVRVPNGEPISSVRSDFTHLYAIIASSMVMPCTTRGWRLQLYAGMLTTGLTLRFSPASLQVGWIGVTLFEKICLIIASTIPEKTIDDARGRGKEGGAGILYSVYYVGEAESHLNDAMF